MFLKFFLSQQQRYAQAFRILERFCGPPIVTFFRGVVCLSVLLPVTFVHTV